MIREDIEKSLMLDVLAKHLDARDIIIHSCKCCIPKHLIEVKSEDGCRSLYGNINPHMAHIDKFNSGIVYWVIDKEIECLDCHYKFDIDTENINF